MGRLSPKTRTVISVAILVVSFIAIQDFITVEPMAEESLIMEFIVRLIAWALVMAIPIAIMASWIRSAEADLYTHNILKYCKECDFFFRLYQSRNSCPHCGSHETASPKEYYEWMDHHPDFPKHDWRQYIQFHKLGRVIDDDAFERRSHEMFMRYWNREIVKEDE
jgi:hypothetical protein